MSMSQRGTSVRIRGVLGCLLASGLVVTSVLAATPSTASPESRHAVAGGSPDLALAASDQVLPSGVPSTATPSVFPGRVDAIARVGGLIVIGGTFTKVAEPGGTEAEAVPRPYLAAFQASTGELVQSFQPQLDGPVRALAPAGGGTSVYVGGEFTKLDGQPVSRVLKLDLSTGAPVPGFTIAEHYDGPVNALVRSGQTLYVGGLFTHVGATEHAGLVALNPDGTIDDRLDVQVAGLHNTTPESPPTRGGVWSLDVSPSGDRLVAVGNFTTVDDLARDQIVMLRLDDDAAVVMAGWATHDFEPLCAFRSFASYMRGVAFSPSGAYFVVVTTGGPFRKTLCDSATRWETSARGSDLHPTWKASTGGDTLHLGRREQLPRSSWADTSASSTTRWPGPERDRAPWRGQDSARWTPATVCRSRGTPDATPAGSGPARCCSRRRASTSAATPPRSGRPVTPTSGRGSRSSPTRVARRSRPRPCPACRPTCSPWGRPATRSTACATPRSAVGGSGASGLMDLGDVAWDASRGAFKLGKTLWYGWRNGTLHRRSIFANGTLGPDTRVNPYHDPLWKDVATGSGEKFDGEDPDFYAQIPTVSGMYYIDGRLYYTRTGVKQLAWREFSPESGIIGAVEHVVPSTLNWASTRGVFRAGPNQLYYANAAGALRRVVLVDGVPKAPAVAVPGTEGVNWAARGLTLYAGAPDPNKLPIARPVLDCSGLSCGYDGSTSTDPDGVITGYHWDFGDGSTSNAVDPTHTYVANGTYHVTLTVTDDNGQSASSSRDPVINASNGINAVGATSGQGVLRGRGPAAPAAGRDEPRLQPARPGAVAADLRGRRFGMTLGECREIVDM